MDGEAVRVADIGDVIKHLQRVDKLAARLHTAPCATSSIAALRPNVNVQGSVDERETEHKHYVSRICLACGWVHMVNPRTGRLMSEESCPRDEG